MNSSDKNKIKHDVLNSIVIINSLTKSASSFINKVSNKMDGNDIEQEKLNKFLYSMTIIRQQTAAIERCFQILLEE